jgi:hypothetical protein
LTPGYLDDLSDTKFLFFSDPGSTTTRQTLMTPATGKRLRLIRVSVHQIGVDGLHFAEIYFGRGADISTDVTNAIDHVRVPDQSTGSTRTWGRGTGPVGARNEALSIRWTAGPTTSHKIIVEYTEER